MKDITYISASAGSGKTTRIINELVKALQSISPSEVMMTTFTRAAAQEMQERAKKKLLELDEIKKANEMGAATIGTIHSVCLRYIQKYWYLIGISPDIQEMDENDFKMYVDLSLFQQVKEADMQKLEQWRKVLNWTHYNGRKHVPYISYWSDWLRTMVDKARYYHIEDLEQSRAKSIEEIETVFARYAFNREEYNRCAQDLINHLPRKKNGDYKQASIDRINTLKTYDPIKQEGKIPFAALSEGKEEYDAWVYEINKITVFANRKKEAAIAIVNKLFDILTAWRNEYQKYKVKHKLLDFNDMEVHFLELLKTPEVQAEIKNYKLVLVDEFQDCNPIQVYIFKRISDLVPRSIWVGDPKQAIYGFRGTDTTLVKEVSDQIKNGENGCAVEPPLDTSYRSVPELVKYVNDEFLEVFKKQPFGLMDKEIQLSNQDRVSIPNSKFKQEWNVPDKNGVAYRIKQLIEQEETYIQPKDKNLPLRPATYGDIAILVRTNNDVSDYAKALREYGVPFFATEDNDKEAQPIEQKLLMELAQYKFSKKYRPHLRADILHVLNDVPTQELLEDYLAHISVSLDENDHRKYEGIDDWKKEDELIARIDQIVTEYYAKGLFDTLTTLVDRLNLYDLVAMWGDPEIRRSNIHRVLQLAEGFDHHCEILKIEKPTFADYAKYMADAQAKTELDLDSPSVKILTMHKSKGLEWPIVIYCGGGNNTQDEKIVDKEYFGVREQRIDDDNYWLRVFPCVGTGTRMNPYLSAEPYFRESKQRVEADETRLRYVAFTRARDILITVTLDKGAQIFTPIAEPQHYTLIDTAKTQQDGSNLTYLVKPSECSVKSVLHPFKTTEVSRIGIHSDIDSAYTKTVGTCIHNIYAACNPSMDEAQAIDMAQTIIDSFTQPIVMRNVLKAKEVITAIRALYDYLSNQYGAPTSVGHEVPFSFVRRNGQLLRGEIDLLWYVQEGVVLVDYKNIQGEEANPEHYKSQMEAYREVIEAAGLKCKGIVLFYATLGQIIELQ